MQLAEGNVGRFHDFIFSHFAGFEAVCLALTYVDGLQNHQPNPSGYSLHSDQKRQIIFPHVPRNFRAREQSSRAHRPSKLPVQLWMLLS